jgi:hypothetical protein
MVMRSSVVVFNTQDNQCHMAARPLTQLLLAGIGRKRVSHQLHTVNVAANAAERSSEDWQANFDKRSSSQAPRAS